MQQPAEKPHFTCMKMHVWLSSLPLHHLHAALPPSCTRRGLLLSEDLSSAPSCISAMPLSGGDVDSGGFSARGRGPPPPAVELPNTVPQSFGLLHALVATGVAAGGGFVQLSVLDDWAIAAWWSAALAGFIVLTVEDGTTLATLVGKGVLAPLLCKGGVLDPLVGKGGVLAPLVGKGGVLAPLVGKGGVLAPLVGKGGVLAPLVGKGGVLAPLVGKGGVLAPLVGKGGVLAPLVGKGGVLAPLVGKGGVLDPLVGKGGVLAPLVGKGGVLAPLVGKGGVLAPLVGKGGVLAPPVDKGGVLLPLSLEGTLISLLSEREMLPARSCPSDGLSLSLKAELVGGAFEDTSLAPGDVRALPLLCELLLLLHDPNSYKNSTLPLS